MMTPAPPPCLPPGNPYAVWRQREFEKRLEAERQRRVQARKEREKDLIVRCAALVVQVALKGV